MMSLSFWPLQVVDIELPVGNTILCFVVSPLYSLARSRWTNEIEISSPVSKWPMWPLSRASSERRTRNAPLGWMWIGALAGPSQASKSSLSCRINHNGSHRQASYCARSFCFVPISQKAQSRPTMRARERERCDCLALMAQQSLRQLS